MSSRSINACDPALQLLAEKFIEVCNNDPIFTGAGAKVFIDQTYRDEIDQNYDYGQGRTREGKIITNARYGQSPHNCVLGGGIAAARAFDFGVMGANGVCDWDPNDALWQTAIAIGEELGLVSGSEFHSPKDAPHFELANWNVKT